MDTCSRRIIYLKYADNNWADTVLQLFMDSVEKINMGFLVVSEQIKEEKMCKLPRICYSMGLDEEVL